MNDEFGEDADHWREAATFNEGSWWPLWEKWLAKRSGRWIKAREPGDSDHPSLEPAPGSYVKIKANQADQ